jgi:HD-GYP domain-containing protein (c-di-GMP phosphodiesterase class II)
MGQKIHPTGFRLPVTRAWASRWYASNRNFSQMLAEDLKVREFLKAKLKNAAVSRILIERPAKNARITIHSARPGVVIGKKGQDIEVLKKELGRMAKPIAVEAKDPYTAGHSHRVRAMSLLIGREIGLSPERLELEHQLADELRAARCAHPAPTSQSRSDCWWCCRI